MAMQDYTRLCNCRGRTPEEPRKDDGQVRENYVKNLPFAQSVLFALVDEVNTGESQTETATESDITPVTKPANGRIAAGGLHVECYWRCRCEVEKLAVNKFLIYQFINLSSKILEAEEEDSNNESQRRASNSLAVIGILRATIAQFPRTAPFSKDFNSL
jgi:hypothetical protein